MMADGSAEVDRLTVVWDANFSRFEEKLNKAIRAQYDAAGKMTKKLDEVDGRWGKLFGKSDPGKALDKVFDSSRLRLFDSATARIGLTGSALEALGPVGLTAAASVAALGAALEAAHKSVEFADNLFKLAKNAHVSTDELQAFQFAVRLSGGNAEEASAGLAAFSAKLGQAQEGLPRAQRAFLALGFSKEQIKGFADAGEALIAVTERIGQLKSTAQKDAVVQQLGLDQMKPLIEGGVDQMREFLAEAQKAGVIMDAGLVRQGHEINEQMETLNRKISVELSSAFIELGPLLLDIVTQVAKVAEFAAEAAKSFHDFSLDPTTLEQLHLLAEMARGLKSGGLGGLAKAGISAGLDANANAAGLREATARDRATRAATGATDTSGGAREDDPDFIRRQHAKPPAGTRSLIDTSKTKAAPRDDSRERQDAADAALAQADRARLQALAALTGNLAQRAEFELAALNAEATAEKARLQKQIDDINADKGISGAKKERLTAELEIAKQLVDAATLAKQDKIRRDAAFAIEDVQIGVHREIAEAQIAQLEAEAAIATTAKARREIEERILALRQQLERDLKTTAIDRDVKTGAKSPEQGDVERRALAQNQAAQRTQFAAGHEDPVEQFRRSVQDLDTTVQNEAIGAFRQLSDQIGQSAAKAVGLKGILGQLFASIVSAAVQKSGSDIFAAVLHAIPGFATGVSGFGGGWAVVGERGPELVKLPAGSDVIANGQVQAMAGAGVSAASAGGAVNLFDLRGAVMTQDLLNQMNRIAAQTTVMGVQASRRVARADLQRSARRALS
jgi:hypothetical protein